MLRIIVRHFQRRIVVSRIPPVSDSFSFRIEGAICFSRHRIRSSSLEAFPRKKLTATKAVSPSGLGRSAPEDRIPYRKHADLIPRQLYHYVSGSAFTPTMVSYISLSSTRTHSSASQGGEQIHLQNRKTCISTPRHRRREVLEF